MQSYRSLAAGTVAGIILFSFAAFSFSSDDLLTRAARHVREKDFGEAYSLAARGGESPRRSFLMGVASLRQGNPALALPLLAESEQKLQLIADYSLFYQAEALFRLKRYGEASARAAMLLKAYPQSLLVRRAEKLMAEALHDSGDHGAAIRSLQSFVEKYPSGADSVEALFMMARSREEIGDKGGAQQVYRLVWLNNPAAPQAAKSLERLKGLEKAGLRPLPPSPEELLKRAATLYAQNEFTLAARVLREIDTKGQPAAFSGRVDLKSGMTQYRLRNWKQAEKELARVAVLPLNGLRSEARFWLAKALERQDQNERAFAAYMELVGEGKKQEYADDALMEAAGLRRSQGAYLEAARLYEQLPKGFPDSKFVPRAAWENAWCRYLAGEKAAAAEAFKLLAREEGVREKALYWLARSLESTDRAASEECNRLLQAEFPAGFYATWARERHGVRDSREGIGSRNALAELTLPAGYDKPLLLASLGLLEEARSEMAAIRRKNGEKKGQFPGLARLCLEMGDYGGAIALFMQNRPVPWDKPSLPLWTAGYPRVYPELVSAGAAANGLPESLVYALIRAESGFNPLIKSPAGAIGLMQLMPATARLTAREKGEFNPLRLTDPEYNVALGTKHLRELIKGYDGDVIYSAAAYNAGAAALERWRKNLKGLAMDEFIECIPYQETRDYVKKVYASAATYRVLYGMR